MKYRFSCIRLAISVALFVVCCASYASAQGVKDQEATKADTPGIASVRLNDFTGAKHYLVIDLSEAQNANFANVNGDLKNTNIKIKFLPSGKEVPSSVINNAANHPTAVETVNLGDTFGDETLQIGLLDDDASRPEPGDDRVEVTFGVLHFAGTGQKSDVNGTGKIYNRGNINKLVEETRQALKEAVAHAKTDEEKDAFIGLNVVIPSGGGNNTEGSGEINFNRDLYASTLGQAALFDHIKFGFHLNKASENKADPRHFDLGFTFRKTFLRANRAKLNAIKDAISSMGSADSSPSAIPMVSIMENGRQRDDTVLQFVNDLQQNFVRAFIFDNALRFEGDVSDRGISNVSNLLWDTQLQVATVSRALAGRTGFWNFRWVPVGFEIGGNLTNNDDPTQEKNSLARFKSGGEFNLIFKAGDPSEPISRIQISAKALDRYLFKSENTLDEMTQKVITTDKGNKYWLEADVKISTGVRVGAGRVGFKATFQRGFLPPVYNFVKTFKFGVVFETNDDDNSSNIKVK